MGVSVVYPAVSGTWLFTALQCGCQVFLLVLGSQRDGVVEPRLSLRCDEGLEMCNKVLTLKKRHRSLIRVTF